MRPCRMSEAHLVYGVKQEEPLAALYCHDCMGPNSHSSETKALQDVVDF